MVWVDKEVWDFHLVFMGRMTQEEYNKLHKTMNITEEQDCITKFKEEFKDFPEPTKARRCEAGLPEAEDIKCILQDVETEKQPPLLIRSHVTISFFDYQALVTSEKEWNKFKESTWYKIYNWFN